MRITQTKTRFTLANSTSGTRLVSLMAILIIVALVTDQMPGLKSRPPNIADSYPQAAKDDWHLQRAYPANSLPKSGFYQAWQQTIDAAAMAKSTTRYFPPSWTSIGPTNQGGRTLAVVLKPDNPNIVYAGSASGGLWKMTVMGNGPHDYSWERINTGYPVLGVSAIAIDPRDTDVLYIGTGEVYFYDMPDGAFRNFRTRGNYSIGLLKSTDGGATWSPSIDWSYSQLSGIAAIKLDPLNPDIVYAATTDGVYRSSDAGNSWDLVLPKIMAMDLVINPQNPDIVFASCGNFETQGLGIYRSMDRGLTWSKMAGGLPDTWSGKTMLSIYEEEPNVVYADVSDWWWGLGVYRSQNNGDNWELIFDESFLSDGHAERAPNLGGQGYYSHYVRVNPVDSSKVFKARVTYATSVDGGRSYHYENSVWNFKTDSTQVHPDHHAYANHPDDPEFFYIAHDAGISRTFDGGLSFQTMTDGYVTSQFYQGFTSSRINPDFAIGGLQDNSTAIYRGSDEWDTYLLFGDGAYTAIDQSDNEIVFSSLQYLLLFRSKQGGRDWTRESSTGELVIISPYEGFHAAVEAKAFIAPFVLLPGGRMFAATNYIYTSPDTGTTWYVLNGDQPLNGQAIVAMDVSESNPSKLYAATVPAVGSSKRAEFFASFDGGKSWENRTGDLPDRYISDLTISRQDDEVVYLTFSGFGSSHVYRTWDGGLNWVDIGAGLPDLPTNAIVDDPMIATILYVGNDLGVWVSTDDGRNWDPMIAGMPDAVMVMDLSISDSNRKIRAVTHGNGIYEASLLTAGQLSQGLPTTYHILPNYPNPFNDGTAIRYRLDRQTAGSLIVYNLLGETVKILTSGTLEPGLHESIWNGVNEKGVRVASGIYIVVLRVEGGVNSRKIVLLK